MGRVWLVFWLFFFAFWLLRGGRGAPGAGCGLRGGEAEGDATRMGTHDKRRNLYAEM